MPRGAVAFWSVALVAVSLTIPAALVWRLVTP